MINKKIPKYVSILALEIAFLSAYYFKLPQHSLANTSFNHNYKSKSDEPSPASDAPNRTRSQGTRGSCTIFASGQEQKLTIIPITPLQEWNIISNSPTLWFYIDYESGNINEQLSGILKIDNFATREQKPEQIVLLPQTSGIFSVSVSHVLEPETWYQWYLDFEDCENSDNFTADGYFKQIKNIIADIENEGILDRVNKYVKNNLWYDAFNTATQLTCRSSETSNFSEYWRNLLTNNNSVFGLDEAELREIANSSLICSE